jgi:hypothetical protein
MVAKNDVTGDSIQTKSASKSYRDNYDNIFRKNTMTPKLQENDNEVGKCGCGRSPTGKCIGWHSLSESEYQKRLAESKAVQQS